MESSRVAYQISSTVTHMAKMGLREKKAALMQIAGDLAPHRYGTLLCHRAPDFCRNAEPALTRRWGSGELMLEMWGAH